jgi:beta-glucanase (GH16 family)
MKTILLNLRPLLLAWAMLGAGATAFGQPPAGSTWELTFIDDFLGTSLDRNKWNVGYGWGRTTGWTQEYIADDHVLVQNGLLRLKQSKTAQNGKLYTAGAVNSKGKFTQKYGYFEAKIKMNTSYGMHFGWWAKQSDDDWPPELDIMELVAREPWRYTNNIHYLNDAGTKYDRPYADDPSIAINQTLDYHVYGCEWRPDAIIFYVDGNERRRITDPVILGYFHRNAGAPNYTGGDPFYLLLNVHIGHDWAGYPNSTTVWPNYMDVDWVKVYKKGTATATNLVRNGEFDNGTADWVLYKNTGTVASLAAVTNEGLSGTNSGRVYIDNGGTADWHVSVGQALPISSGNTYRISFRSKVGAARTMRVGIQQNGGSNTVYWNQTVNLTTTATTYTYTFTAANTDATTALRFFVGGSATDVHLDAVSVTDGSTARQGDGLVEAGPSELVKLFPNPARDELGIAYQSPVAQAVQLTLRNAYAGSVGTQAVRVKAGANQLHMNVQALPTGLYFLELRPATGSHIVKKVLVAR